MHLRALQNGSNWCSTNSLIVYFDYKVYFSIESFGRQLVCDWYYSKITEIKLPDPTFQTISVLLVVIDDVNDKCKRQDCLRIYYENINHILLHDQSFLIWKINDKLISIMVNSHGILSHYGANSVWRSLLWWEAPVCSLPSASLLLKWLPEILC